MINFSYQWLDLLNQLYSKCLNNKSNEIINIDKDEKRNKIINDDDIMNLKIDLNKINTIDDLLKNI